MDIPHAEVTTNNRHFRIDVVGVYPQCIVADIGVGTGIFSAVLLERDVHVAAVEPNDPMREGANRQF